MATNSIGPGYINDNNAVVSGDFNGDGRDDLFFLHYSTGNNRIAFSSGGYDPDRIVTNRIAPGSANGYDTVLAGDFDGDCRDDLFFLNRASGASRIAYARDDEQFVIVDDRVGGRGAINGYDTVLVGNFNGNDGDGRRRDDLFFFHRGSGSSRIAYARGVGQFDLVTESIAPGDVKGFADMMTVGDFDGDLRDDIVFLQGSSGFNRIAFARGNRTFTVATNLLAPGAVNGYDAVVAGDFYGDHRDDLYFQHWASGSNRIAYSIDGSNNVQFNMTERVAPGLVNGNNAVSSGDFDHDGKDDLFFVHWSTGNNRSISKLASEGTLFVIGSNGADNILVQEFDGNLRVTINGAYQGSFAASTVGAVEIRGLDQSDAIDGHGVSKPIVVFGSDGDDTIYGGNGGRCPVRRSRQRWAFRRRGLRHLGRRQRGGSLPRAARGRRP